MQCQLQLVEGDQIILNTNLTRDQPAKAKHRQKIIAEKKILQYKFHRMIGNPFQTWEKYFACPKVVIQNHYNK